MAAEETDLVLWLVAERAWHQKVAGWQRDEELRAVQREREKRQQAERDAKNQKTLDDHARLVDSVTGFRRASLARHGPVRRTWLSWPICAGCSDDYEGDRETFPCDEYDFARDWSDSN